MPNSSQKLAAPGHGAAEARAGCHRGRRSGERRRSDALVPKAQGPPRDAQQQQAGGVHVAGSASNSSPCALCEHREQQRWGSVKTVQPRVGAPHST